MRDSGRCMYGLWKGQCKGLRQGWCWGLRQERGQGPGGLAPPERGVASGWSWERSACQAECGLGTAPGPRTLGRVH